MKELHQLLVWYREGKLNLADGVVRTIGLEAEAINAALNGLERVCDDVRVVIVP